MTLWKSCRQCWEANTAARMGTMAAAVTAWTVTDVSYGADKEVRVMVGEKERRRGCRPVGRKGWIED